MLGTFWMTLHTCYAVFMRTEIVETSISLDEIQKLAHEQHGDFVKAVVDIERHIVAVGGELHADQEQLMIEHGSKQGDIWGINIYPTASPADWIEFDSMINIRPSQGNRSRGVDDREIQKRIRAIVEHRVVR